MKMYLLKLIKESPILMFSKTYCPYCYEAKNILKKANLNAIIYELDNINNKDLELAL